MNNLQKTVKYLAIVLIVLAGAIFFYVAGLGTGLYIAAQTAARATPQVAVLPTNTPLPIATSAQPTPTAVKAKEGMPTATPVSMSTSTPAPITTPSEQQEVNFDLFWETWGILQEEFYGDLPEESDLPYAAIRGVIASTGDEYTAFLDPAQANIVNSDMSGSFEGIGATVRLRPDGKFEIVQPLAGYPAIKAGVRTHDVIVEVDGIKLDGMSIYEAISLIRGPAGTTVRLLIEREKVDDPLIIEVERARIELEILESKMLDDGIAYIRLTEFSQPATDKLTAALTELLAQEPRGLILDLRSNPGGYLSTAVEVGSQFVGEGPILIERFKDGREHSYEAISGGLALDIPLVVLVDGGSASASEIVAGAIQDTGRAPLIGVRTLGKGSVQLIHTLSNQSQLRVTVAHWFTPNGRAIHGEGLEPDIEVEISEDDVQAGRDPQLDRAVQYLLEGK